MSESVRAFFAVPLDPGVRARVATVSTRLATAGAEVKWVEAEDLHVTLLFLGETSADQIPAIADLAREAAAAQEPFDLDFRGVGAFPNLHRPGTLWLGVASGLEELRSLNARLRDKLAAVESVTLETRGYTPHLTLGRVRSGRNRAQLVEAIRKEADWTAGPTPVREIILFKSELKPDGPEYTELAASPLGVG